MTAAHWIGDGGEVPAVPLKAPEPRREWRFGRYEIALAPRQGRWIASASPLTGAAGYRTLIGAILAARRVARREAWMAQVRVCGVCWKPVRECICDDAAGPDGEPQDGSGEDAA